MKVLRSTLVIGLAAFAAACGDKVNIVQPTSETPVPTINSVTVTPGTATLSVGQTVNFTAAVDASNGAATTVTWGSSDASKVSVDASGKATAVAATPGVAICATSTANTGKVGCASVVVSAAVNIPATVTIASITKNGGGGTVNPAAVVGTIDITANIAAGSQTVTKIVAMIGTTRADSQTFSAAQSAALRYAADKAIETQSAFPPVLFSINTAKFNATTGAPTWLSANYTVSVVLYTAAGGATAASTATYQTPLTFANADTWFATVATSGTTANALNGTGYRYDRGALTVSVLPVSYSGGTVASGTATFGSAACDGSGTGARTVALVAPAAGSSAWTATFSQTAAAGAGNVNGYEFNAAGVGCALNAIGETPTVTAVNTAGDALFAAAAPVNVTAITGIRLDNRAPVNPAGSTNAGTGIIKLNLNPNGRANNWLNDAVTFNGSAKTTATSNNYLCAGAAVGVCVVIDTLPRDGGVGGATYYAKVGATKTAATTAAAITSPASLAATVTNTDDCIIAYSADALGNETASPSTATACGAEVNSSTIGIDRAAPTIAYTGASIAANARISGASIGGEFIVTVNDTGLVGNSGMLPTAPVQMRIDQRVAGAANSSGTVNPLNANGTAGTAGKLSATGVAGAAPLYSTAITALTGAANHAYYTHNATAFDAAGNSASVTPRVMVYDNAAPVPGAPSAAVTLTASGYTANAFISEDLDIQDFSFGVTYGAPAAGTGTAPFTSAAAQLQMPVVAVSGYNAATFANTNYGVNAAVPLPLALQANVAAGLTNMAGLYTTARAQSNLAATSANFVPGVVTPGTAISTVSFTTFPAITLPAGVTGVVTGNTTAAAAATPASAVLTATITGATAVFNNPFSRMDFYMKDATGTRYFNVGSATVATLNDNGATRTFTFTTTISGATVYALLGGAGATFASDVVAVGIGAANSNIGMVSAAATAINVVF